MHCVDDSLLQMLVEGTLDQPVEDLVRIHLRACPECRRKAAGYKQLMWDLSQEAKKETPPELDAMHDALLTAWKDAREAERQRETVRRSLVPAWAGYSLLWTRHAMAPVQSMGSVVSKLGGKLLEQLTARRVSRRGGGGRR